jgi:hypothetical protein
VYYFFINGIVCLYVNVWSVVNDPFVEYVVVEDQEDFEQQQVSVEGKSLSHPRLSYYNMHFNYIIICLLLALI